MTAATAQASYCQKKVPLKKNAVVGSATVLADAASEMFSALAVVSLDHNIVPGSRRMTPWRWIVPGALLRWSLAG